jgi:recombination protein RecT
MTTDLMKIGNDITSELKQSAVVTPSNYSLSNALKSAYLILQETVDRNKKPALEVCTSVSIHNALLKMACQGLNPAKNQCYFVVYGTQLQCIRSYMGAQMTAKLVNPSIKDIRSQVVHEGDTVEIDVANGQNVIKKHTPKSIFASKASIIGAYALAVGHDEKIIDIDIMSMDDIKSSWKQSKVNPIAESGAVNQGSTHGKFTEEMAKRTVINRLCKRIINTSDDTQLLNSIISTDDKITAADVIQHEINENANQKELDYDDDDIVEIDADQTPPATIEQARMISDLSSQLNQKERMMEEISGYVNKKIAKISELTFNEAEEYIEILKQQTEEDSPDWADT